MRVVPPFLLCYDPCSYFLERVIEALHPLADIEPLNPGFHRH